WWFANFTGYSLWGIGYAVGLKIIAMVVITGSQAFPALLNQVASIVPLLTLLLDIAGMLMLLQVPRVISSATGGSGDGAEMTGPTRSAIRMVRQVRGMRNSIRKLGGMRGGGRGGGAGDLRGQAGPRIGLAQAGRRNTGIGDRTVQTKARGQWRDYNSSAGSGGRDR
ncbi:MAG TPA: hypothetical protein VNL71_08455, partial [Chloroflexota bacterium]|nr:hypothetical protein [Chloroflexota bacterium]